MAITRRAVVTARYQEDGLSKALLAADYSTDLTRIRAASAVPSVDDRKFIVDGQLTDVAITFQAERNLPRVGRVDSEVAVGRSEL